MFARCRNVRIGPRANQILVLSPAADRISSAYPRWKCTGSLPGTANIQHISVSTLLCILTDFRNLWEFSLTLGRKRSEEMLYQNNIQMGALITIKLLSWIESPHWEPNKIFKGKNPAKFPPAKGKIWSMLYQTFLLQNLFRSCHETSRIQQRAWQFLFKLHLYIFLGMVGLIFL